MQVTERLWVTDTAAGTATRAFAVTYDSGCAAAVAARLRCLTSLTGDHGLQVTRLPAVPGPAIGVVGLSWGAVHGLAAGAR